MGISGSHQTLFYVEVGDEQRVTSGGGLEEEGEMITVLHTPRAQAKSLITDCITPLPVELKFAVQWFFAEKSPSLKSA